MAILPVNYGGFEGAGADALGAAGVTDFLTGTSRPSTPGSMGVSPTRQTQMTSSELSWPDCARSVKRWAMR